MALTAGTRLGPYEIQAPLGAGGMGEVYKARDTRLDRIVAIKILPPEWTNDPSMKERFNREAQTIASLNHPNICVLHDVGQGSVPAHEVGLTPSLVDFLVMEFLDGETLADRLTKGPLPLDEAMTIAMAVADALDKAHRQGVIHRDLKPANIMLVRGGGPSGPATPKLLDFGLATSRAALPAASNLTLPGMIIGTMQYMAPEQFDGVEADRRTDIFAFGVVLHEMVTGKKTFEGKSQVMLISAIATTDPQPVSLVQPAAPPALDHIVKTCLAKDPADRWQDVRDLLAELQWIAEGGEDAGFPVLAAGGRPARRWWRPAALAASVVVAAALAAPAYSYFKGAPEPEELRFRVPRNLTAEPGETQPGTGTAFATFSPTDSAISPDGTTIAFVARPTTGDTLFLYLRPVGSVTPKKIEGTEDASQPFWSPDGQWVVFFNRPSGKLKRVLASGSAAQNIGDAPGFQGGSLNAEGTIIFGSANGLFQVPAEGGKPAPLTTIGPTETGHFAPRFLPDGHHYLYLAGSTDAANRAIFVGTLDSQEKVKVLAADSNAVYTASRPSDGYLVFHNENAVYAQPFSTKTLALSGKPVRVANEVVYDATTGRGSFDVSDNGVLIYYVNSLGAGGSGGQDTWPLRVMWTDRSASDGGELGPYFPYRGVELSPDGKRVAVHRHDGTGGDIWIMEPPPTAMRRITFDATQDNSSPIWSPGGDKIAFASHRNGKWGLYQTASDGSGVEELLVESELPKAPMSWSKDGKRLVFWVQDPKTAGDIWVLPMDGEKKPVPLIATAKNETHPQISWDGKWIAYTSDLTGRKEVYVQPFPSGSGRYQVSPDASTGGDWPRWKRDGKELYYHSLDNVILGVGVYTAGDTFVGPIYSASITVNGSTFVPGSPVEVVRLMAIRLAHSADYHTFDVSQDGQRILTMQRVLTSDSGATGQFGPELPTPGLTVAMHWMNRLKK